MIFTARTTVGQETLVLAILQKKVEKEELSVYSLTLLPGLKGYILIEADSELTAQRAIYDVPNIKGKGLVGRPLSDLSELSSIFESKPLMSAIKKDAEVQIIAGPFKGEKAKVLRINEAKEEVTVELLEAAVKIPVTIKAENIKLLKE